MPLINSEEHIGQARPSVWWPQFDNLYEALREACMSDAPSALLNLEAALAKSQAWLAHSLLGFQPPSPAAKAQLEKQEDIQTPDNKRMPITAVLSKAALQLSTYLVSVSCLSSFALDDLTHLEQDTTPHTCIIVCSDV